MRGVFLFGLLVVAGCSQAFRFTEDAGDTGDAGTPCALAGECECAVDSSCPGARPHCSADRQCVECTVAAHCGTNGLCDAPTQRCVTRCDLSSECTAGVRNECESKRCTECERNTDCAGTTPVCARASGYCVACDTDLECAAPAAHCDRRFGTCVGCRTSADCATTEYCVAATGICQARP